MSVYTHTYVISTTFPDGFYPGQFDAIIRSDATLSPIYLGLNTVEDILNLLFSTVLDSTEQTVLDAIIADYVPIAPTVLTNAPTPIFSTSLRRNNGSQGITNNTNVYNVAMDFPYPGNMIAASGMNITASNPLNTSDFILQDVNQTTTYGTFTPTLSATSANYTLYPLVSLPSISTTLRLLFRNGGSGTVTIYSFTIY
jgi:hypothetical protein